MEGISPEKVDFAHKVQKDAIRDPPYGGIAPDVRFEEPPLTSGGVVQPAPDRTHGDYPRLLDELLTMTKKRRGHGEGSIHQNKNGRWVARYWTDTPTGRKRRYLYGGTRREVQEQLIAALAERDRGVIVDDQLTVPTLGKAKLAKLQPHHVQRLYDEKGRIMSPASVRLIHSVLSGAQASGDVEAHQHESCRR